MTEPLDYQSSGVDRRISKMAIAAVCISVLAEPIVSGRLLVEFLIQLLRADVPPIVAWLSLYVIPGIAGCLLGLVAMIRIMPRSSNLKGMMIACIGFATGILSALHGSLLGIFIVHP